MSDRTCTECKRGVVWRSPRQGLRERLLCRFKRLYPWRCGYCGARFLLPDNGEAQPIRAPREILKHL